MEAKTFLAPDIDCEHCAHTIEREVGEVPGVKVVKADEATKQVTVQWDAPASWEKIVDVLYAIHYPPVEMR
jgi:copper chaperone CopZ